ncbi:hypothetical protein FH972_022550 [Carpinus fangiana]|uniref:Uncharacterized protein n=1 Tax=Carpinus fangiana TaxID=176857 RepID=A0A5N6KSJ6_9ROSI|nr:hypothetical protein FH972_022550 [Carpinus fangiana]
MGMNSNKPPLPAPTDSCLDYRSDIAPTDLGTDISHRTDKTSYSIPEDGSPVTLPTKKTHPGSAGLSQASLLIEYFEVTGSSSARPSVRVKVTPSSKKRSNDLNLVSNRNPSYTHHISLSGSQRDVRSPTRPQSLREVDTSNNNASNSSELSSEAQFRSYYIHPTSDISSMPADSMIDTAIKSTEPEPEPTRSLSPEPTRPGHLGQTEMDTLKAPSRRRSRSLSKERITQKVLEKLAREQSPEIEIPVKKVRKRRPTTSSIDAATEDMKPRSRKSSRSNRDEEYGSVTESSLLHTRDRDSSISGMSKSSLNPKLLQTVEDVVRRLILPEIETIKRQQSVREGRPIRDSTGTDYSYTGSVVDRQLSQSSSLPYMKPKVVLNRDGEDPGLTLAGDSVRHKKHRRVSKESSTSKARDRTESIDSIVEDKERRRRHRDLAAAGIAGAALTAAALKTHDSRSTFDSVDRDRRERRKKRSKSHGRTTSVVKTENLADSEPRAAVPRLPMDSEVLDSELTRESILSAETAATDNTTSPPRKDSIAHVREVTRGSPSGAAFSDSRNAMKLPARTGEDQASPRAVRSSSELSTVRSDRSLSSKSRKAALMAAGFGAGSSALYGHDRGLSREQKSSGKSSFRTSEKQFHPSAETDKWDKQALDPTRTSDRKLKTNQGLSSFSQSSKIRGLDDDPYLELADDVGESKLNITPTGENASPQLFSRPITDQPLRDVATNAAQLSMPQEVESHVASLLEPSIISSESGKSVKADRDAEHDFHDQEIRQKATGVHESSSAERWAALRGLAQQRSADTNMVSMDHNLEPQSHLHHNFADDSDLATNDSLEKQQASILEGPLGDEHENRGQWPYEPTPPHQHTRSGFNLVGETDNSFVDADGTAAGLGIESASPLQNNRVHGRQERSLQPSPLQNSGSHAGLDTKADRDFFVTLNNTTETPINVKDEGRGIDNIQSKDVVALMDHLTVRDGQRNARDTEILVTLVRSAAEMRNSFEDMKNFVEAQNRVNIPRSDAAADRSLNKALSGPGRIAPSTSPRVARSSIALDDNSGKKKNIFQRALKGLTGKNTTDLSRMEEMLMQLLDEVEALRTSQGTTLVPTLQQQELNSFEQLRSVPEAQLGDTIGQQTISKPSTTEISGYVPGASQAPKLAWSGGEIGAQRADVSRFRPLLEGDEDNVQDSEDIERDDGILTPTDEARYGDRAVNKTAALESHNPGGTIPATPPGAKDVSSRHKSTGSSLLGQYGSDDAFSSDAHSDDMDDGDGQWIEPVPLPRKQSPYSPGGLLAPIEERYSLEHTRSSISATPAQDRLSLLGDRSDTPQQAPRPAVGGSDSPTARKITGPREMPMRARVSSRG